MTATAYIALGSNLGDRREHMDRALAALRTRSGIVLSQVSRYHETAPVGGPSGQPNFLNAVAKIETDLEPGDLLHALLEIENSLGRIRHEHHGPRTIDLDLLLYGDFACNSPELTVPHPRMHERLFVLEPLVEIAAGAVHPVLGRTAKELLQQLRGSPAASLGSSSSVLSTSERSIRELAGLRVMVTGSTSGIGRAIALELAAAGADVIIHGRRSGQEASKVAEEAIRFGCRSHVILSDLRVPEFRDGLVRSAWDVWGRIDIWINNAGADTLTGEAARWSFERKLEELLAIDVTATMLLSREAGWRMKEQGKGVILNIGWDQAETGMEGDSGEMFAATKAAVMGFSKSLALSLAPEVRVNCLAPGWIRTSWGESASESWQKRVCRETPLGRWGTPEDVAVTARWLVSPAAAFVTGQTIRVNGGAVRG